ncbi:MAG TPA: DUF169 domain-containing protein, partial [Dehalococcoidales bacterium]|nr:DUF169 domain-containing protein [Dehalococcoidales bacterium]
SSKDFAILDNIGLERKPVGVKFTATRPQNLAHLSKTLNMCEMLKEAQTSEPFYVTQGDFACVEPMLLGYEEPEPILVSGLFGGKEKLFQEERACREMYNYLPYMKKGSVHSVAFASADKMPFDPDVLVMMANVTQAQTLLRSVNYSTGEPITSKFTPVCMCAWIFNYPVVSGKMNFVVTGLGLGMQALNIFPPGIFIISVPWTKISAMLNNLKEMGVERGLRPATPGPGGDEHRKKVKKMMEDLRKEIDQ